MDYKKCKFKFDNISVDPTDNSICINGIGKRLEPKVIELLCYFANNSHQVVTREQLSKDIWPGVIIGNEAINRAVFALRNALNDDAKSPKYLETIPKKGYRFIIAAQPISPSSKPSVGRVAVLKICVLVIFAMGLGSVALWPTNEQKTIAHILPITKYVGIEKAISYQASSNSLLFVHETDSGENLFSLDLKTRVKQQLSNDDWRKFSPVSLPNGSIVYARCGNDHCQIVQRNAQGELKILVNSQHSIVYLSVNPDTNDTIIFSQQLNNKFSELIKLNLNNGMTQALHNDFPQLPEFAIQPLYAADGKSLYYIEKYKGEDRIAKITFASGNILTAGTSFSTLYSLAHSFDSHNIIVTGAIDTAQGIWQVSEGLDSSELLFQSSGGDSIVRAIIDPVKQSIIYQIEQRGSNMSVVDLATGIKSSISGLNSHGYDFNGFFSEDMRWIYFNSNRSGYYELWRYNVAEKTVEQLSFLKSTLIIRASVSSDNRFAAFTYKTDKLYLAILDLNSKTIYNQVIVESFQFPLGWDQDNQYFYASEHQDKIAISRFDVRSMSAELIAQNAGLYANEVEAGQSLVYMDYVAGRLVKKDLQSEEISNYSSYLKGVNDKVMPGQLVVTLDKILVMDYSNHEHAKIVSYDIPVNKQHRQPKTVFTSSRDSYIASIAYDGSRATTHEVPEASGDIMEMRRVSPD